MQLTFNKKIQLFLALGLLCKMIAAIFNTGIFHADAHYQIFEFISYKYYGTPAKDLAWEFHAAIRPWFQPFVYIQWIKLFEWVGLSDKTLYPTFFRLISVLINFLMTLSMTSVLLKTFQHRWQQLWSILLLNFIWFIPFLSARTSAEGLGMSLMGLAFAHFYLPILESKSVSLWHHILTGLLFGITFLIRFHMAFFIIGICFWALIYKKRKIHHLFIITSSTLLVIGLSIFIDYWGYDKWVFTPWRYFQQNIIQGIAAGMGKAPWWRYLYEAQKEIYPLLGALVVISFLVSWIKERKSIFVWGTLPFFIIHSYIMHKELRFIFPLAIFIPFHLVTFISYFSQMKNLKLKKVLTYSLYAMFIFNLIVMALTIFKPLSGYEGLYTTVSNRPNKELPIYYLGKDKAFDIISIPTNYYGLSSQVTIQWDIKQISQIRQQHFLIMSKEGKHYHKLNQLAYCKEIYPRSNQLQFFLYYRKKFHKKYYFSLFDCKIP